MNQSAGVGVLVGGGSFEELLDGAGVESWAEVVGAPGAAGMRDEDDEEFEDDEDDDGFEWEDDDELDEDEDFDDEDLDYDDDEDDLFFDDDDEDL